VSVACGRYEPAFALDDPEALVDAALSCPACLSADSRVVVGLGGARGSCRTCGSTWALALGPHQLMRLSFDPPRLSRVEFSSELHLSGLPPQE
jgi:hypothetical protein